MDTNRTTRKHNPYDDIARHGKSTNSSPASDSNSMSPAFTNSVSERERQRQREQERRRREAVSKSISIMKNFFYIKNLLFLFLHFFRLHHKSI